MEIIQKGKPITLPTTFKCRCCGCHFIVQEADRSSVTAKRTVTGRYAAFSCPSCGATVKKRF